jgi:hypothetical protein
MSTLVLMRHGQASFGEARYDALSGLGLAQAQATGAWLRERGDTPTAVWHGPRRRHADTAAQRLASAGATPRPQLAAGLEEFAEGEEVLAAAAVLFGRPMSGPAAPSRRGRAANSTSRAAPPSMSSVWACASGCATSSPCPTPRRGSASSR